MSRAPIRRLAGGRMLARMNLADLQDIASAAPVAVQRPRLTQAKADLTREVTVVDESGQPRAIRIPAERDLTVYVDKRELVTLMTLGAAPELLVLGYLRNQRIVDAVGRQTEVSREVNSMRSQELALARRRQPGGHPS